MYCRFQKKYMLLHSLWYSSAKPTMTTFLKPLIDEVNELDLKGSNYCNAIPNTVYSFTSIPHAGTQVCLSDGSKKTTRAIL